MPRYYFIKFSELDSEKDSMKRASSRGKFIHFVKLKEPLEVAIAGKKEIYNAVCTIGGRSLIFIDSDEEVMLPK